MIGAMILMAAITLPPCPSTPNCVSTEGSGSQAITPFRYSGSADEAMRRLLAVLQSTPRTTIVSRDARSMKVEFRTRIFRFVDDALFVIDDDSKTIHFRSASRLGRSDFGVNRKRIEEIRGRFNGVG